MRTLLLMRHGKSDWGMGLDDQHRPLARRGRRAARMMGRLLAATPPDTALTSPAARATETLRLAQGAGKWSCDTVERAALYGASAHDLLQEVAGAPPSTRVLLVVGHEPTCSEAVRLLTGGRVRVPTGAVTRIDLEVDRWKDLALANATLIWHANPQLLSGRELAMKGF